MAVEIQKEGTKTKIITYLDGNPYSASYIKIETLPSLGGVGGGLPIVENFFLHRDFQGSILALSNSLGKPVEQRYFDAWGNLKALRKNGVNLDISNISNLTSQILLDRGYTGHEHLWTVGLIHMNGRIYDPMLRRFVSPDNYVQDPYNTQSYNRYAYVWNNPLMYTDPSGELLWFVPILVGAAIAVTMKAISNIMNGVPFWYGMGKTFTQAIVGGALSFAVGMPLGNMLTTAIFEPGADIGDLGTSFAMGLLQAGLAIGNVRIAEVNPNLAKALSIVSGGISGGLSAAIAGGNFWQGFKQGAFSSGLNTIAMDVIHNAGTEPKSAKKSANTSNSASGGKKQKVADPQPALIDNGFCEPNGPCYLPNYDENGNVVSYTKDPNYIDVNRFQGARDFFGGLEDIGGGIEVLGLAAAIPSGGSSLLVEPFGAGISAVGTAGNIGVDVAEYATGINPNGLYNAGNGITKAVISGGMGKLFDRAFPGFYDNLNAKVYHKILDNLSLTPMFKPEPVQPYKNPIFK